MKNSHGSEYPAKRQIKVPIPGNYVNVGLKAITLEGVAKVARNPLLGNLA
jgi:hypothetical protein